MSKTYSCFVRHVPSVGCLDIAPAKKPWSPTVRRVYIAFINDKRLGTADSSKEEPGAFKAREYIREKYLNRVVEVEEVYVTKDNRSYVIIKDQSGVNPYTYLVEEGLIEARPGNHPVADEFMGLTERAKVNLKGVFAKRTDELMARRLNTEFTDADYAKALNLPLSKAIVEKVSNPFNIYAYVPKPRHHILRLTLAGITKTGDAKIDEEATEYVRQLITSQDVELKIVGKTNYDVPVAQIVFKGEDVSASLLGLGLAKYNEWTGASHPEPQLLLDAQKHAMSKGVGIWVGHIFSVNAPVQNFFKGIVVGVHSATAFSALLEDNRVVRYYLTALIGPKFKFGDIAASEEWALEGWLNLRKMIIGKEVNISVDYEQDGYEYASVLLDDKNVSATLLETGYVKLSKYAKDNESKAAVVASLLDAASKGSELRFAGSQPGPKHQIKDYDSDRSFQKSDARRGIFIQNGNPKRLQAIPMIVRSPVRFKMFLPEIDTIVPFNIEYLTCPEEVKNSFVDSLAYKTYSITITDVNKAGYFLGCIYEGHTDIGESVISQGLAAPSKFCNTASWLAAAEHAEKSGLGIWSNKQFDNTRIMVEEIGTSSAIARKSAKPQSVVITHVNRNLTFWVRLAESQEKLLNETDIDTRGKLTRGRFAAFCIGKQYRRVTIQSMNDKTAKVLFVDAGEEAEVQTSDLFPVRSNIISLPRQAALCSLANVHVFKQFADDVYENLRDIRNQEITLETFGVDNDLCIVDFTMIDGVESFVEYLLDQGLANINMDYPFAKLSYESLFNNAFNSHSGAWADEAIILACSDPEEAAKCYA